MNFEIYSNKNDLYTGISMFYGEGKNYKTLEARSIISRRIAMSNFALLDDKINSIGFQLKLLCDYLLHVQQDSARRWHLEVDTSRTRYSSGHSAVSPPEGMQGLPSWGVKFSTWVDAIGHLTTVAVGKGRGATTPLSSYPCFLAHSLSACVQY